MTINDLERALERYGGDLGRWPEALRGDAARLIATDAKAARIAALAARLDGLLAEAVTPLPVDAAFIGRVVAEAGAHHGHAVSHEAPLRPTPRFAAFAGAAMVVFLAAGYVAGLILPSSDSEDIFAGLMFGNSRTVTDTDTAGDAGSAL